jgi:polyisoprenoid-binding protein YceI
MKQISIVILGIFVFSTSVSAGNTKNSATVFNVETKQSKVLWTGKKVTGEHTGTLNLATGEVMVEGNTVINAQVKMDMNSIVCTDITNADVNQKLVGHLKSDDFFSVDKFPQALFSATTFKPNPAGSDGNNYLVSGKLTIKGITRDISFPAKVEINNGQLKANGKAKIDRTQYDIKYGSGSFFKGLGDNLIYNDFEIEFDLVASAVGLTSK